MALRCGVAVATRFRLTDEEMLDLFDEQLPSLLARRPELESRLYHAFMKTFATKSEVAAVLAELREHRSEFAEFRTEVVHRFEQVDHSFEQVDQRFEQVDQRFEQIDRRFDEVDRRIEQIDRRFEQVDQRFDEVDRRLNGLDARVDQLEARMEAGFKDMHRAIDRLGARWGIRNESIFRQTMAELLEQSFGVKVEARWIGGEQFDCVIFDGEHVLVEIFASVGPDIQRKLERKRELYTQSTDIAPARVILVAGAIHSKRAQALREAGFIVLEPEEDALVGDV
jgi:hypothetical protein